MSKSFSDRKVIRDYQLRKSLLVFANALESKAKAKMQFGERHIILVGQAEGLKEAAAYLREQAEK